MELEITGEIVHWRGPAPYHFVTVPSPQAASIKAVASAVTYGWGMIPVRLRIGATSWDTALWPRDGLYVVPLRSWVREAEELELGDTVTVRITVLGPR